MGGSAAFIALVASTQSGHALPWPLQASPANIPPQIFSILDFADGTCAGDNVTNCTAAVHGALAAAAANGGGTVLVPHGPPPSIYRTLPLDIRSNRTSLRVESGATLLALCDPQNWPLIPKLPSYSTGSGSWNAPFVGVTNATDVVIDGDGTIDGSGHCFWSGGKMPGTRGNLLLLSRAARVEVSGVTLSNSPFWTTHVWNSSDVRMHDLRVVNPASSDGDATRAFGPNTDGFDIDSSRRVLLEDSWVSTGDDCVVIKSGKDAAGRAFGAPTVDVLIRNMTLAACSCFKRGSGGMHGGGEHFYDGCGALKIGTEMSGGVENVLFEHNRVKYAGQALKLLASHGRGGYVRNVTWRHTVVEEAGGVMWLEVANASVHGAAESSQVQDITVQDFQLDRLNCHFAGIKDQPQTDCHTVGVMDFNAAEAPIRLTFSNVTTLNVERPESDWGWHCTGPPATLALPEQPNVSPKLPASCGNGKQ